MASPKLPIRLRDYVEEGIFYPREVTEKDGKLYLHNEDGSVTVLNESSEKADALSSSAGSNKQPVYFKDGKPVVIDYTIESSVPANAKFTDTVYTHPSHTAKSSGLYKITVDAEGHISATSAVTKSDITGLGIPGQDTVYTHPSYTAKTSGLYKITVDATGHVSSVEEVSKDDITDLGIPAEDTNTTYTAGSGLGLSGTTFSVKTGYTASGKNYAVKADSNGNLYVNVPWTDEDTVYTHPSYTAKTSGLYKITVDETGHVSATAAVAKSDITALGIPAQDTVYTLPNAGTSLGGVKSGGNVTISGGIITVNDNGHKHTIDNITNLQSNLDAKVPTTRTVNGKALSSDITLNADDVGALDKSLLGAANGVAQLDSNGLISSSMIPGSIAEYVPLATKANFPSTGDETKIYLDKSTNLAYRWDGSDYQEISPSIALGTTSTTAFRGDYGNTAYTHSQVTSGNPHKVTKSDVGLDSVENKSSATIRGELTKANVTDALGYTPPESDTVYTHPSYTAKTSGLYKVTVDATGHVSAVTAVTKSDITALGIPAEDTNTTYTAGSGLSLSGTAFSVKTGYTTSGKNYAVKADSSGNLYVNVPWTDEDTVYTHPSYTAKTSGLYKVTVDATGHVSATTAVTKSDITALGIPSSNTTYSAGTGLSLSGTAFSVKTGFTTSGKNYAVTTDDNGNLYVNVPWTDNNTIYTHPSYTAKSSGLYKVTVDATGHVSATTAVAKSDITALGIPAQDTVYTHPSSGVTAASYGPSENASPAHGGTFSVPYVTVNAAGHVTAASTKTITLPTYSLSSFGITATATELNYTDGVTSNIQTQLNSKAATTSVYSATIGTTWSGSGPYTQTITVSGITANDTPIVDLVPSTTQATAITQMAEYQKIFKITTAANSITVYATSKTTSSLSIQLRPLQ